MSLSIEKARDILSEHMWVTPKDYAAFDAKADPVSHYNIYGRHRDSTILENCNYDEILGYLEILSGIHGCRDKVYDFRAGHWAVGWVEEIIVEKDAHDAVLIQAAEYLSALSDYPILDEQKYSDTQFDAVCDYWISLTTSERMVYCTEHDVSVFASRRDHIPNPVFDDLIQSEMFF